MTQALGLFFSCKQSARDYTPTWVKQLIFIFRRQIENDIQLIILGITRKQKLVSWITVPTDLHQNPSSSIYGEGRVKVTGVTHFGLLYCICLTGDKNGFYSAFFTRSEAGQSQPQQHPTTTSQQLFWFGSFPVNHVSLLVYCFLCLFVFSFCFI